MGLKYFSDMSISQCFFLWISHKSVILDNGLRLTVPPFVNEGDLIQVRVEDTSYVSRVTTK
jgi:hypothetical protein